MNALEAVVAERGAPKAEAAALYRAAKGADPATTRRLLDRLGAVIRVYPAEHTGLVAVLCGALIEAGAAPEALPSGIFDRLVEMLDATRPPPEDDDEAEELPEWYYSFEQAAIAALSRSATLRRELPQRDAIRRRLRTHTTRYSFLGKMIEVLEDEPVLVLHPSTRRGWQCRMSGIGDNFQLHVLLLAALSGSGSRRIEGAMPSATAVAASTSGEVSQEESVGSTWQLANWCALREDGTIESSRTDVGRCWIWNEGFPAEIAPFDGLRVILVGPSSYLRNWSAGRPFPAMSGSLRVERQLDEAEAASIRDRILARLAQDSAARH